MRKTLSIMAASTLLAIGLGNSALADDLGGASASEGGEKSGIFVGVHGGVTLFGLGVYDVNGKKVSDKDVEATLGVKPSTASFNVGLKAGYQYFFMPLVGVRGYLGYDFNGSRSYMKIPNMKDVNVSFQNITLNADVMVNFLNTDSFTLGAYVGFGLGYGITSVTHENKVAQGMIDEMLKEMNYNGFNIPINVGIAATFAGSHKVEIGAKIQALSAGYSSKTKNNKSEMLMNTHVINVGYSYIF